MNTQMNVGEKSFKEWLFLEDEVVSRKKSYAGYFKYLSKRVMGDFPGSPVVETLSSRAGGAGLILGLGAKIPCALWPKN